MADINVDSFISESNDYTSYIYEQLQKAFKNNRIYGFCVGSFNGSLKIIWNAMTHTSERIILLGMIGDKITKLKPKCKANKRIFQGMTAASIAFSAAITVTVGLDWSTHAVAQKNIALMLGLVLTLVNGWMAIFDYKKLWMRQKSTLFGLYHIENELNILNDSDENIPRVKELFQSYQSVWEKDTSDWAHIYSAASNTSQKSADI